MNPLYLQAAAQMTSTDFDVLQRQLTGNQPEAKRLKPGSKAQTNVTEEGTSTAASPASSAAMATDAGQWEAVSATSQGESVSTTTDSGSIRSRQYQHHDWPLVGAVLTADYFGQQYRAVVIPAQKKLLSGRQLKIDSGPAAGSVCDSLSAAMILATEEQRQKQGLRRKGVANGWDFWQWEGK